MSEAEPRGTGPDRFDVWMERALYDETTGFYARGGAGRRDGDFITSPEVGPLFGAVIARAAAAEHRRLGAPDGFEVIEVGAGRGTLAVSVLAAGLPPGVHYRCVERSATLRAAAKERLGSRVEVVAELARPAGGSTGMVIANELLDNLPVRMLERTAGGWADLGVDGGGEAGGPRAVDGHRSIVALGSVHWPDCPSGLESVPVGTRVPRLDAARLWVDSALGQLSAGRVVVIDYGVRSTVELVDREWLRTYAGHVRGTDPFAAPDGHLDVTVDVAFDQLPGADLITEQREYLVRHGLDELVEDGRRIWHERAHIGDLEAVAARSRISEAEALRDPSGLGGFLVAEWVV